MPSVCEGSRFTRLGDAQGFMEKSQIFISLMDFIATFFHCVREIVPRFLRKLSFDTKFAEKNKLLRFGNDFGVLFISSIGVHINLPNCQIPLDFSSRMISISIGEEARN